MGERSKDARYVDVLLKKMLSGVAELRHTMLYGKSQRTGGYFKDDKIDNRFHARSGAVNDDIVFLCRRFRFSR